MELRRAVGGGGGATMVVEMAWICDLEDESGLGSGAGGWGRRTVPDFFFLIFD